MAEVERFETMRWESGPHTLIATSSPARDEIELRVIVDHGSGYAALRGDGSYKLVEPREEAPAAYVFPWPLWQQLSEMILDASPAARLVSETTQDAVTDARAVRDRLLTLVERLSDVAEA